MKGKKFSLLRILTVGAACALTSIFLFCGCSAKPTKSQAPDGADAYGVYTNLTLSLDCGEGKVWASVKNTFTLMPSKVRVSVELYASEDYKPSYKEMSLVSENAVTDLNMGDSVTAEATTNGKEMFWQARAYYKVDEKDWQERTTKIWQIKGNGNIVTTNAQPPKTEELPAEPVRFADIIEGAPFKAYCQMPYEYNYGNFIAVDVKKATTTGLEDISTLYSLLGALTFEYNNYPLFMINWYHVQFNFDCGDWIQFFVNSDYSVGAWYFNSNSNKYYRFECEVDSAFYEQTINLIESIITINKKTLPAEPLRLKDLVSGVPTKSSFTMPSNDGYNSTVDGIDVVIGVRAGETEKEEELNYLYEYFKTVMFELQQFPNSYYGGYQLDFYFDNGDFVKLFIGPYGKDKISGYYVNSESGNMKGLEAKMPYDSLGDIIEYIEFLLK